MAAGHNVDLFETYKLIVAMAARAQVFSGGGRRSDAAVTMAAQPDLPTPPLVWKHLIEFYKACYPAFEHELNTYARHMDRIAVMVSNKGLLILDHAWRSLVFETSSSFLPGGAIPAAIAVELHFVFTHHLRPAPDAAALSCSNCGRQHRAEECPSFVLAFKHAPDPSDPRQRRCRSSSRRAARSPSESLSPPPLPQPLVVPPELASQVRTAPGQAQARRQVHGQRVGAVHLQALRGEAGVPFRFDLQVLALGQRHLPHPHPQLSSTSATPCGGATGSAYHRSLHCLQVLFFHLFCIKNKSLSFALCVEAALVDAKRAPVRPVAVA